MAIEKTIIIKADTKDAKKNVDKLTDSVEGVTDASQDLETQNKVTAKSAKSVGLGVRAIGTALKAIGIGLVIALFAKLVEVFSRNQKVVDFFSASVEVLSIAFNDLFNFLFDNAGGVIDFFKDIFENPLENLKKLGEAIKKNLIERFVSLLEVSGFLADAFVKIFEGDFSGAIDSIKEAGEEMADVFTGVDDTVDKVVGTVEKVVKSVSNYAIETIKAASANIQLKNSAELAAAQQGRLVEQFDRAAEQQRKLRDDQFASIQDRIKASNQLKKVLDDQEKAMLSQAGLQVAAAQAQVNTNNSIENQVALTDALANKEAILAQIQGFRTEQFEQNNALRKEEIELDQTIADADKERQLSQLAFEEEQATTEAQKLEFKRQALDLENEIILQDLERKRELYKEGTQARVDAEQEFLTRKQELDNERKAADKQEIVESKVLAAQKEALAIGALNNISEVLGKTSAAGKAVAVALSLINTYQGITAELATKTVTPFEIGLKIANIATVAAIGFKSVKDIMSTKLPSFAGNAGGGGGGGASAPSFNVVGNSGVSQIGQTLNQDQEPVQAFVVGNAVTSQQALDRDIVETATLG
tara:strand:+ start:6980 stop:8743 length:1764 start_codon:yes stop_codon:yes gene_type:complete